MTASALLASVSPAATATSGGLDQNTATLAGIAIITGVFMIVAIVGLGVYAGTKTRKEREQTKREIAAYAAEGSITADEATKMIRAAERNPSLDWMCSKKR